MVNLTRSHRNERVRSGGFRVEKGGDSSATREKRQKMADSQLLFLHVSGETEEGKSWKRKYSAVETLHCIIDEQAGLPISEPLFI